MIPIFSGGRGFIGYPTTIEGLQLWLDAADSSTITESSGNVSGWADKSGRSHNSAQPTGSHQPPYRSTAVNGRPAIGFDSGTTHNLVIPHSTDFDFTSEATFIVVSKPTTVAADNQRVLFKDDVWAIGSASDNSSGRFTNRTIKDYDSDTGYFVADTPLVWSETFGGTADVTFRKNGALFGTVTGSSNINTSTGNVYVGNGLTTRVAGHDISEILVYNRVLSSSEMNLVEQQYLLPKWGIST